MFCLVEFIQQTKERLGRTGTVSMMSDLQHVTSTCIRLQDMLSKLLDYVDGVIVSTSILPSSSEVCVIRRAHFDQTFNALNLKCDFLLHYHYVACHY